MAPRSSRRVVRCSADVRRTLQRPCEVRAGSTAPPEDEQSARRDKQPSARWARYPPAPEWRGPVLEWIQRAVGSTAVSVGLGMSGLLLVDLILFAGLRSLLRPQAVPILSAALVVADSLLPQGAIDSLGRGRLARGAFQVGGHLRTGGSRSTGDARAGSGSHRQHRSHDPAPGFQTCSRIRLSGTWSITSFDIPAPKGR